MKHPNASTLETLYAHFKKGDLNAFLSGCDDSMTFQVAGKSKLAGKYTKTDFSKFAATLQELSGGTLEIDIHDILASDLHAAVLATDRLTRGGKTIEYRTVHVWRFQNGKPVAWYEYPRDLYQYDAIWT